MATHPLTAEHVLRESYDPDLGALKTVPGTDSSFEIELSHDDGDSVNTHPNTLTIDDTTPALCLGIKSIVLYMLPGAAASAKIQVSPVDSGDVWVDVPSSTTANDLVNVTMSSVLSVCARRMRVSIVGGTPDFVLVGQAV